MSKMLSALFLLALLSACTSTTERQDQCTPQWPPGPCDTSPPPPRGR